MEAKAAELLAAFKNPNLSVDAKVAHLTAIKSEIKQKNVPEGAIPTIFDTLRLALTSQHTSVLGAGFSTLGHFLKRLSIQDQQQWIVGQARNFYPLLMERLGDHKERVRAQAASIFTELWSVASNEVEYYVLETALTAKNPRAKEMSMLWLSNVRLLVAQALCRPLTRAPADDKKPRLAVSPIRPFSGRLLGGCRQRCSRHSKIGCG
jgi:CLIP-associating protein 1/2